jgi:murein DD-endopeptidase MepM/ murein hydrolase activator NlpD
LRPSESRVASKLYPLARKGPIIGTPYHGTHTRGNWQSDNAIDIAVPVGTPVYAVADGVIDSRIGPQNSKDPRLAGNRVTIDGQGNRFFYQHLSKLSVAAGQHVREGDLLGYSGEANGTAHLHFAVERGTPGDAIRGAVPAATTSGSAGPAAPTSDATAAPVAPQGPALGTPPGATNPVAELPGSAQHYLPGEGGAAETWQTIAALPDLAPDTQRLIQLSSGG